MIYKGDIMSSKKSEFITLRITPELKEKLQSVANGHRWTLSQTAAIILEQFCNSEEEKRWNL